MAGKILAQLVVMGGQVFLRAFTQAYRQAAANAGKAGATGASQAGAKADDKKKVVAGGMEVREAWKVLGLEDTAPPDEIESRFKHLFEVTDRDNGGTLYIQSKVYRAKEALDIELGLAPSELPTKPTETPTPASTTPPPAKDNGEPPKKDL